MTEAFESTPSFDEVVGLSNNLLSRRTKFLTSNNVRQISDYQQDVIKVTSFIRSENFNRQLVGTFQSQTVMDLLIELAMLEKDLSSRIVSLKADQETLQKIEQTVFPPSDTVSGAPEYTSVTNAPMSFARKLRASVSRLTPPKRK